MIKIIFGSTEGATQEVAETIAQELSHETEVIDIADASNDDFDCENLILGTSTWGDGELQEDWDDFFSNLDDIDFSGKKVAFFGLGDQESYCDVFVDGMGTLYEKVKEKGGTIIGGDVDGDSFDFEESTAFIDEKFVGLVIDEDNQSELTEDRIKEWTAKINSSFN
jgi:flavodoxin I